MSAVVHRFPTQDSPPATLPHSEEVERAVLAGVMLEPRLLDELPIWAELFYVKRHQVILAALATLRAEGSPIDERTTQARLEAEGTIEDAGGVAYLSALTNDLPDLSGMPHYVCLLEDLRLRRELINLGNNLVRRGLTEGSRPEEIIGDVQARILGLTEGQFQRGGPEPIGAAVLEAAELYCTLEVGHVVGLSTGLRSLDEKLGGFERGRLIVIAGRPGMGKSSLAQQIAEHQQSIGEQQLYVSLEMSRGELATRAIVRRTGIAYGRMRDGYTTEAQRVRIRMAAREIVDTADFALDDRAALRLSQVTLAARATASMRGLRVLWVDHLGLLQADRRYESRTLEVGAYTAALKALAKDLNITVVALHQLNRKLEERSDHRPMLSDLRDSGSVEQDADVVIFVHRPEVYDPDEEVRGLAELIVAKNRDGATGTAETTFLAEHMAFRDLAKGYR